MPPLHLLRRLIDPADDDDDLVVDQGDQEVHEIPLGHPTIRSWEITESSTRYDRLAAAPSDRDLVFMWRIWVPISGLVGLFVALVLLALLTNRKARNNPFNLYLVYLMIPDILFSACCALTCLLNAIHGEYISEYMCQFQSFYLIWGFGANSWVNLLIARELHSLLLSSVHLKKFIVPTRRQVTIRALAAYLWAAFVASWGIFGNSLSWFPHGTRSISGLGCWPLEYNFDSTLFYFLAYIPAVSAIPIGWVLYICFDIWWRKLMPPAGKRRLLTVYFLRIVVAYIVMWAPNLIFVLSATAKPWFTFVGGTWGHLQGVVSAAMSLTKPDILRAFILFWKCKCDCINSVSALSGSSTRGNSSHILGLSNRNFHNNSKNNREASSSVLPFASTSSSRFMARVSGSEQDQYQQSQRQQSSCIESFDTTTIIQQDEDGTTSAPKESPQSHDHLRTSCASGNTDLITAADNHHHHREVDDVVDDYLPLQLGDFQYADEIDETEER